VIDDLDETYLPIKDCAKRLGLSVPEVMELVSQHVLKARRYGGWLLEVQPALVPGVTTSTPDREKGDETMRVSDALRILRKGDGGEPDIGDDIDPDEPDDGPPHDIPDDSSDRGACPDCAAAGATCPYSDDY
jgi:hypothetical protein